MASALKVIEGGKRSAEVIEVSTAQLTEHSKQAEYSPQMSKKKWREFVASVAKEGILQPIVVTKGFRVIDGKHRLKAAKELNIEYVRVIIEDIPEDDIPAYITETKLNRDDLKSGQKAALVIRLFYEEERMKAKERQVQSGEIYGIGKVSPDLDEPIKSERTDVALAKKAGIGKSSMAYLLAVYRNRPDLFERVFNGEYSINKAYTEMRNDEAPEPIEEEKPIEVEKQVIEQLRKQEEKLPQIDESQPLHSLNNRLVQMRKKLLFSSVEVLDESDKLAEAPEEIRDSVKQQAMAMAKACTLLLGQNSENEKEAETLALIYELFNKLQEEN